MICLILILVALICPFGCAKNDFAGESASVRKKAPVNVPIKGNDPHSTSGGTGPAHGTTGTPDNATSGPTGNGTTGSTAGSTGSSSSGMSSTGGGTATLGATTGDSTGGTTGTATLGATAGNSSGGTGGNGTATLGGTSGNGTALGGTSGSSTGAPTGGLPGGTASSGGTGNPPPGETVRVDLAVTRYSDTADYTNCLFVSVNGGAEVNLGCNKGDLAPTTPIQALPKPACNTVRLVLYSNGAPNKTTANADHVARDFVLNKTGSDQFEIKCNDNGDDDFNDLNLAISGQGQVNFTIENSGIPCE